MADAQNKSDSKEKNAFSDLDIGNDFLSSWKSMSAADGDGMDFDMPPVSKGSKKPFNFDKADMDFNLDGDFGKLTSFDMDMSDLDISPPFKKDGKSNEKSKESSKGNEKGKSDWKLSSFEDMDDFDISPPLKKDGKSSEKSNEPTSGNEKGKADRFSFAFDFDELDNFNFEPSTARKDSETCKRKDDTLENFKFDPSLTKESSKVQKDKDGPGNRGNLNIMPSLKKEGLKIQRDKDKVESSENSDFKLSLPKEGLKTLREKDGIKVNAILEGNSQEMDESEVVSVQNLSATAENFEGKDESESVPVQEQSESIPVQEQHIQTVETENATTFGEERSQMPQIDDLKLDVEQVPLNAMDVDVNSRVEEKLEGNDETLVVSAKEMCAGQDKTFDVNGEQGTDEIYQVTDGSKIDLPSEICLTSEADELATPESFEESDSHFDFKQTCPKVEINKKTAQVTLASLPATKMPLVEADKVSAAEGIKKTREFSIPKLSRETNPDTHGAQKMKTLSDSFTRNLDLVKAKPAPRQRGTSEDDPHTISSRATLPSLKVEMNKKTAQVTLASLPATKRNVLESEKVSAAEGINKLTEFCIPKHTREKDPDIPGVQKLKTVSDLFTQNLDLVKAKPAPRQRGASVKDPHTISSLATPSSLKMEMNKKSAQVTLASLPATKRSFVEREKVTAAEGIKKTPELCIPKLSSLTLDSTKSPSQTEMRFAGNIKQNSVLRDTPKSFAPLDGLQKKTTSPLSLKRKSTEEHNADKVTLYPSKRVSLSPNLSRNFMETSKSAFDKKVSYTDSIGDDCIKNTLETYQVSATDIFHKVNSRTMEMSVYIENNVNIKQAEAYTKELDDICNMLRTKQEDAKELLVQATVNSNRMLMLNYHLIEHKIGAMKDSFAKLSLSSIRA